MRDGLARYAARGLAYAPLSLPDMFFASAAAEPAAALVDFLGRRFSYAQIAAQARALAAGLQVRGIGKGDRVGLFLPNIPLYLSAYYGVLATGASVVNYPPVWNAAQLARALAETTPKLVITVDVRALLDEVTAARSAAPFPELAVGRLAAMLPPLKASMLALSGRGGQIRGPRTIPLAQLLAAEEPQPVAIDPLHDLAVIQYSSGTTTGLPRAVRLSHQNLTANARQLEAIDPWHGGHATMIGVLPLATTFGNSAVLNRTVFDRGCIALLPRFVPREVLHTIKRTRAGAMPGIPTMFQALLDDPGLAKADLTSLRVCISGGAPLSAPLKRKFEAASGATVVEGYGLTEAAGVVAVNPLDSAQRPGSAGKALPGTRWTLLDRADPSRPAPAGEPGELAVAGPQVMLGYWNDPAAQAEVFSGDWLRTGDYATADADGYLTIIDRLSDAIASAGTTIFPSRIEEVLLTHELVREAVVIGIPDAFRGESPKAFVTLSGESFETGESLRNWLNGRLPANKRVLAVEVRSSLPRVPVGKLDRTALRLEEAERARAFKAR
ncbi:AMP-binding protein [Novosphingobium sp. Gsoil 351]|uniref:AMP-binding protein n=1 Tax=Novosphingobium sp. Gsoil 351 TaxID=2675225 RepID=UPI001E3FDCBD|nr:AMP-binding protein [Novosphingobium sp. Gsoil 351]